MSFKGVIFDLNGVLWWDSPLQEAAWQQSAAAIRGRPFSPDEMAAYVHGRTTRDTLEYLAGRPLSEAEAAALTDQKETIYRRMCLEQGEAFRLSPGAADLLDTLAARRIPRTIATAAGWENLAFFIEHLGLARWFTPGQIVYDDGTRPGKPAPDVYLEAARVLGLPPAACVVVEDARSGIEAARAAGIGCIIALGPPSQHDRLAALPGVSHVIERLGEFPRGLLPET
ncbi:MAG: HAD family phosphatase [Anaerolineae bacterium]